MGRLISDLLKMFEDMDIRENEQLLPSSWKKSTIDYVVYTQGNDERIPFAFIVCTSRAKNVQVNQRYARRIIKHAIGDSVAWMGLVVHEGSIFSFDLTRKRFRVVALDDIRELIAQVSKNEKQFDESAFKTELMCNIDSLNLKSKREQEITEILKVFVSASSLERVGRTVSFGFKSQFKLICELLKSTMVKPEKIFCRYSSISSLYRNIKDGHESMCGLAAMNDKSEGFYLDYCLDPNSTFNLARKSQWMVDNYNRAFISSLCNKKKADDLTMWRFYGGKDGDGVCLIYELVDEHIKDSEEFILSPVMYGNTNNILVQLFRLVSRLTLVCGYQFVMANKDVWSYFVKPDDFKIEEEYRLLYINGGNSNGNIKWIYNGEKGIVHPIVEFNQNDYPLRLIKIILGPKCCESGVNRVQLLSWLKSMNMAIDVVESAIKIYR